jgi:5-deoxy-D-glucuronate isomerase
MAYTHDHAIDVVGTIYNNDAVLDPDGTVVTPATAKSGFHVNYVGVLPEGWSAFLVTPVAPYRVFA